MINVTIALSFTPSRALVSNAAGAPVVSAVTATELSYVSGATSNLQAQITALGGGGLTINTTPITGGTAGRVLFQSATNKVSQSANLFFDPATDNLGVGITPTVKFQVHTLNTDDTTVVYKVTNPTQTLLQVKANGRTSIKSMHAATNDYIFDIADSTGAVLLNVRANGNMAFGDFDPAYKVDIRTTYSAAGKGIRVVSSGADLNWNPLIQLESDSFPRITLTATASGKSAHFGNNNDGGLNFSTNNGAHNALTLYPDGNAGIGILVPTALLHVHTANTDATVVFKVTNPSNPVLSVTAAGNATILTGLMVGATAFIATEMALFQRNQNNFTQVIVSNTTSGTAGRAILSVQTASNLGISMHSISAGYTTTGMFVASTCVLNSSQTGGLNIGSSTSGQVSLWSSNAKRLSIHSTTGDVNIVSTLFIGHVSTVATALLDLAAGTASIAPLRLRTGVVLTTPLDGTIETDGTNLYFTTGGTRKTVTIV